MVKQDAFWTKAMQCGYKLYIGYLYETVQCVAVWHTDHVDDPKNHLDFYQNIGLFFSFF